MRQQGRLHDWNDDKGFGFVTPNGGGDRAFVHIKIFARTSRRSANGDVVTYVVSRDARGRLQATTSASPARPDLRTIERVPA